MVSMFIWLCTSVLDWITSDPEIKIIWNKIGYLGVVTLPVFWVFLASRFTGITHWLSLPVRLVLFIIPLHTLFHVFTGSFWSSIVFEQIGDLQIQRAEFTLYFWMHVAYSYSLVLIGSGVIVYAFLRFSAKYRIQSVGVLLGALLPFVINVVYVFDLFAGVEIDFTPLGFFMSCGLFSWSLFRNRLFNLVPIATQTLIDQMNDGMMVVSDELDVMAFNQAAFKLIGKNFKNIYGVNLRDIFPQQLVLFSEIQVNKQKKVIDVEISTGDRVASYEMTIQPVEKRRIGIIGYLLVFHETTRFKEIQLELTRLNRELENQVFDRTKQLLESISQFRDLVEKSGVGVYLYQSDRFVFVNQTFADIVGYSLDEIIKQKAPKEFFDIDDWKVFQSKVEQCAVDNQPFHWVVKIRHSSGKRLYVDFYGNSTLYQNSWGLIGTIIDITERLQIEERLRLSEERYRLLVELSPYLVMILAGGQIAYINPAGAKMLGATSPDAVIGMSFKNFLTDNEQERFYLLNMDDKDEALPYLQIKGEYIWRDMEGRHLDVACIIVPYLYQDQPALQVVAQDISGQKEAERRIDVMVRSGIEMGKSLDIGGVLAIFLRVLKYSIPFHFGQVILIDHDDSMHDYIPDKMGRISGRGQPIPIGKREKILKELEIVFFKKQIVHASNLDQPPTAKIRPGNADSVSYLCVPLVINDQVIGCFALGKDEAGGFLPQHIELAKIIAIPAAIAIQNALLFEQVKESRESLRMLSNRLVEIQEAEKRDLANELHDEIGQQLTGLQFILEKCKLLQSEKLIDQILLGQAVVSDIMSQIRNLSLDLRPRILDDLGLLPTLEWYFTRYSERTQVEVNFIYSGLNKRMPPEIEVSAYRIIQESLTNAARYSGVHLLDVKITLKDQVLSIVVIDQGKGFDYDEVIRRGNSSGLTGMIERASIVGGELRIITAPGKGTTIEADLPLKRRIRETSYETYDITGR